MTIRENPHRWPSRWPAYGRSGNDATTPSLLDFEEESAWDALKREAFFPVSEQPLRLPSRIAFTIGVRRKICANGMIGEDWFTYSDPHRHPLDTWLEDIKRNQSTAYGLRRFDPESLRKRLAHLAQVQVSEQDFLAGLIMTLGLNPPAIPEPPRASVVY